MFCVSTQSFTFCLFASVMTLFNNYSERVLHMADMAVGSLAPYTFETLNIAFLNDVFLKLTVLLACMDLSVAFARAIYSRCWNCLNICLNVT